MIRGGLDDYSGELVCTDCVSRCKIKISYNGCAFLKQLSDLHLDDLNTIFFSDNDIIDSICFLESFMLYHDVGLKKIQSMDMVRKLLNKQITF